MKITEYDINYESPDGIDNYIYQLESLHDGLWNEYIDDPELLFKRDYLNIYNADSGLKQLHHNDIFRAAEEAFTPAQVVIIYKLSTSDIKRSGPIMRKLLICDALDDCDTLYKYNIQDVKLLEDLYNELLPWIKNHPNHALYMDTTRPVCTNCGSYHVVKKGLEHTLTQSYQRYKCKDCGAPLRGRTTVLPKEKREHVLRGALK